ncbi:MAG: type II toxin-antitoxin system RelE/ParE family toxin [Tepidisphaeraceae bacterium]|jgi:mRNA interferase RelE/StbE
MRDGPDYRVMILPAARRQLLAIRPPAQDRIRQAIRQLAADPTPADSIPMTGKATGLHRLRVGMHRVVYRIHDDKLVVLVIRFGHRGNVYSGFEQI